MMRKWLTGISGGYVHCVCLCGALRLVCVNISVNTMCILFLLIFFIFCTCNHSAGSFSGLRLMPVIRVLCVHSSIPSEIRMPTTYSRCCLIGNCSRATAPSIKKTHQNLKAKCKTSCFFLKKNVRNLVELRGYFCWRAPHLY